MKLNYVKRLVIETELRKGTKVTQIANLIGVNRQTIYDELKRAGATKETYDARKAQFERGME